MTILERHRREFFRSKVSNEDRSAIGVLATRWAEGTNDLMNLTEAIENAIDRWIDHKAQGSRFNHED